MAREGRHQESLDAWERLLNPAEKRRDEPRCLTGDFLGQAMMRKAWVLMDLGRHAEARDVYEDDLMQACLGQYSLEILYEYFFAYGNTLGSLGDIEAMDDKLSRAMAIGADELGDYGRVRSCWRNLLQHATAAGAWDYLVRECPSCVTFADNCDDAELAELARIAWQRALQEISDGQHA